jgi:hypothetical protein
MERTGKGEEWFRVHGRNGRSTTEYFPMDKGFWPAQSRFCEKQQAVDCASLDHMKALFRFLILAVLVAVIVSCSIAPRRPTVDIKISNDSTNDLNWVRVCWDDEKQTAGILSAGDWKVSLDTRLPEAPKSDTAFVEFVDDKDGWKYDGGTPNSERKHYRIPVDVSALKRLAPADYVVIFSILSLTEAKVVVSFQL